jgi:hypothetical protein
MARETGGRAFVNENDVQRGITFAQEDDAASYTIGYYPENKSWDHRYRRIKVKANRDGTEVRHRDGYYTLEPRGGDPRNDLGQALQDRMPDTLVAFDAKVWPRDGDSRRVEFLLDAHSISAKDVDNGKKLDLSFYAAVFSAEGKMLLTRGADLKRVFPSATYDQILQQGMKMHIDLESVAKESEMRLVVRDNATGFFGTVRAPLSP